jgi:hypothetical protein
MLQSVRPPPLARPVGPLSVQGRRASSFGTPVGADTELEMLPSETGQESIRTGLAHPASESRVAGPVGVATSPYRSRAPAARKSRCDSERGNRRIEASNSRRAVRASTAPHESNVSPATAISASV